ncbi:MAG TPA: nuclear transport factor 2 family protein [Candidatus Acidoferrales bacterium]|jgi:hypothetical protein|nr:nuclear transport factor 2 family protein [Candidatus Acidoferrales bacterium]
MSEEANIQLIQEAYEAFSRGDIQGILNKVSSDVEWVAPPVEPMAGTYRGRDGVGEFFRRVAANFEFTSFEPRDFVAQGDRVVVLGHYTANARNTGRTVDADWAMAFTVSNGQVSRFQEYTDTAAASTALSSVAAATA